MNMLKTLNTTLYHTHKSPALWCHTFFPFFQVFFCPLVHSFLLLNKFLIHTLISSIPHKGIRLVHIFLEQKVPFLHVFLDQEVSSLFLFLETENHEIIIFKLALITYDQLIELKYRFSYLISVHTITPKAISASFFASFQKVFLTLLSTYPKFTHK